MIEFFQPGILGVLDRPLGLLGQPSPFTLYGGFAIRVDHDVDIRLLQTLGEMSDEKLGPAIICRWNRDEWCDDYCNSQIADLSGLESEMQEPLPLLLWHLLDQAHNGGVGNQKRLEHLPARYDFKQPVAWFAIFRQAVSAVGSATRPLGQTARHEKYPQRSRALVLPCDLHKSE